MKNIRGVMQENKNKNENRRKEGWDEEGKREKVGE